MYAYDSVKQSIKTGTCSFSDRTSLRQSLSFLFKHMPGHLWYLSVERVAKCMTLRTTNIWI